MDGQQFEFVVMRLVFISFYDTHRVKDVYYAHMDIKKAIEMGMYLGPSIYGAGHYISITGGFLFPSG